MNEDKDHKMKSPEETARFNLWFNELWEKESGLINQTTASNILGCSDAYVRKMIREKKLSTFEWGKSQFLSLKEVNIFKIKKDAKKKIKEMK